MGGSKSSAASSPERDQCDLIPSHVTIGEQQLNRAFSLRQSLQRRRSRGVHDKERQCFTALLKAREMNVVPTDLQLARHA